MSLILKQEPANTIATPPAGKSTLFITDSSVMAIKTPAGTVTQFPTVQGANTQVFFNDDGAINGSANLAFVKTTNTLTLTNGNVVATGVKTDNLYYANGNPWDLQQPAGSNTQLQFNNNDSFGASANLTFDGTSLNTTANLNVTGNAYISGNLTVDGNVVYVNVESLSIEDPLISLGGGPNGNALTSNNGYDRGLILRNYTSSEVNAFMGWDTSNAEFAFASNVSVAGEVITINTLGNVRANIGNFGGLLVGATPTQANFPNATVIVSQADSGQTHSENIGLVGEAVADSGNTSTWGIGVLGEARANGATKATGVQGGGYVTNSADTGAAVGVRGYSIQTHSGGYNIGVLGNASGSGLGNYAFYVQSGNIGSIETATTWDLTDNSIAALTFQSTGKANIFGIETTDGAEGIYTQGYLNVTGNITATAGIKTDNYYYANGSPVDFQQAGGSNTQIQFNDADAFGGSAAFTFNKTSNVVTISNGLSVTANANVGNLNSGGNIIANGNLTASSAATVTFGDSTTLYSGYTTMNPVGVFHNTANGEGTLQVASGNLANGIAIWTNNVANSFIQATGGIEFITGSTLRANLNPTGGTTQMALTTSGLTVANTLQANIVNSSTTMNAIGNINAGNFVTPGNIQATGTIYSNTSISTVGTITSGGNMFSNANLGCETALYVGNGAGLVSGLDNPLVLTTGTGTKYVQAAIINKNANGSADWIAYGNNGNSVAGWMDMGFTGATFSDANYTITGNNDGYIFSKAVGGAGLGGNLVVATGSTGTTNDIVFATGGFLTANEKMRFINASNQFYVEPTTVSTSTTTGALRVGGGVGIAGNVYAGALINAVGNIAGGNLSTAGTANVGTLNVTGNVTSALLPSANVTYDLGSDTQRWRDIYLSNSSIYLGNARLTGNGNSVVSTGNLTGANISTAGTLSVTGNANVGNLGTSGLIVATGNITGGNLVTSGVVVATGNVTGNFFIGNGSQLTGIDATAIQNGSSNVRVLANANVTISSAGNANIVVVTGTGANITGTLNASGNANVGNIGAAAGVFTTVAGTLTTATQPNITSVGTLSSLTATGNVTGGNLVTAGKVYASEMLNGGTGIYLSAGPAGYINFFTTGGDKATITDAGNIVGSNLVANSTVFATTANVSSNVNAGNILTGGLLSATGNITSNANVVTDLIVGRTSGITITAAGTNQNINLVPTGTGKVNVGNFIISNLAAPVADTDAATKKYVDDVSQGLHTHDSCNAATQTTLASISGGTVTYNNGTSGVGATLTTTGSYTTIDGVTLSNGMRILVKNEATAANNGIYVRTSATVLTRADDFDTSAEMAGGDFTFVTAGTLYDNTGWVMTDPVTTVGTSPVVWVQFSGAGTYTAGTGLTLTGSQFSITNTAVTAGAYGNGDYNATFTVNSQGQLTAAANVAITANAANLSGTTLKSTVVTSSLTSVGTLTTLNVSGNANVGNIGGAAGVFTTVAGSLTTASQPNITSVGTLTSLAVTGNISAGNVSATTFTGALSGAATSATTAGTVTTNAQPNITSTGTLTSLAVTGNISAGNVSATTFTGALTGAATTAGSATTAGTVTTAAQPNITSTGTLSSLSVTGNISAGNVSATTFTGALSGAATSAGTAGTVTTAAQGNITSVGTLTGLSVNGTITGVNITANTGVFAGSGANLTTLNASNVSSGTLAQARLANAAVTLGSTALTLGSTVTTVAGLTSVTSTTFVGALTGAASSATTAGTVTTAAQPNITSVGTLTGLTVGNATANSIFGNGTITAITFTGAHNGTVGATTANTGAFTTISATGQITSTLAAGTAPFVVTSTTQVANLNVATAGVAGTVTAAAQPNITSVGTLSGLSVTATITGSVSGSAGTAGTVTTAAQGNITSVSSSFTNLTFANAQTISGNNMILTTGANTNAGTITGNWSLTTGSRLNATYADLAEYYEADQHYEPGTVLEFGGEKEVTLAQDGTTRVAGVVSTDPAYAMNMKCPGIAIPVALQGRVPTKVRGSVRKGDMMVSAGNGYARPWNNPQMGTVIGKALENFDGVEGIIEVAVGRL